jgi:hypothetical protein
MNALSVKFSIAGEEDNGRLHYHDEPESPPRPPIPRVPRMLALAHHVQHLVNEGKLRDFAHAARILGLSRARLSQIMNLHFLAPTIQERILSGKLLISERQLRPILRTSVWKEQEALVGVGE